MNTNNEIYKTPLAKFSKILEIIIPAYMLGKSWGIAEQHNLDLFKAQFPTLLINITETIKSVFNMNIEGGKRFVSTTSGALIGFVIILIIACINHMIMNDRKFIDSLRFTAIILIPIAVLNGILSHGLQTLMDSLKNQSIDQLKNTAVNIPWGYLTLNFIFYMSSIWVMSKRTAVPRNKRWKLIVVGVTIIIIYISAGFMILPSEWQELSIKLMNK